MKNRLWLATTIILIATTVALLALGKYNWIYLTLALSLVSTIALYRSLALPMRAVRVGIDLLRSQDFASRLRTVGQKDADNFVGMFNSIMSHLKAHRLHNLEQENFLGALIEASPMGIAICSFDGEIIRSNPAFVTLGSPQLTATLKSLDNDGQVTIRTDGTQVLRCSRRHFMNRGFQRPFYLVERLTDEIVKAETQIFHKIVRIIGHEVNNTLGGVVSVLETMSDIHTDDADITAALSSCRNSCVALGRFVKGYSDVVKLPEAQLQNVDIVAMLKDIKSFVSETLPPDIILQLRLPAEPVIVSADPMLLQRVIINAVKNAAESIGKRHGTITLAAASHTLQIIDDGPGIDPTVAEHIFTPFFSTKHHDRGLGLMLIADILRKHHATFNLTTRDGLTALTVTFPA